MNQDRALLATPANARRLMLLQRASNIELDPSIIALATEDCLDASAFDPLVCPDNPVKRTITQFLLDCNMRGIIQPIYHPEFNPLALLNTVRLAKPSQVVVISGRRRLWSSGAIDLPLRYITMGWLEKNLDTIDRNSVLIFDADPCTGQQYTRLWNIAREFPRFNVYDDHDIDRVTHWAVWARLLFPTMPHPLAPRILKDVPEDWQNRSLAAFAVFYNVCLFPDLITAPALLASLDSDLADMIMSHSTLLKLF